MQYSDLTYQRAYRAWVCSPFCAPLLAVMRDQGLKLHQVVGNAGHQAGFTRHPLGELTVDQELLWLIQVGLLRREVDGQGITDSYRLTPLGRDIVQHHDSDVQLGWRQGIYHLRNAWLRWQSFNF